MGSAPITTAFLLSALLAVSLVELADGLMGAWLQSPYLWLTVKRTLQSLLMLILCTVQTGSLEALGLDPKQSAAGLKKGLLWSTGFAVAAGLLFAGLVAAGQDPLRLIRSPLPADGGQRLLFFFVGGLVAPVFEELLFRGVLFGYLRRWGVPAAVLISTAIFAAFHLPTIPVTQVVGGAVFAIAYHHSGSLITPITIHVLGNLAIFTLSLPWFQTL